MTPVISLKNVTKTFSKVIANSDVSIDLYEGEVLSLLGENGAGKSTIMKVLYGLYSKDSGEIFVNGENVKIKSPFDAMSRGIAMIQQHFSLVPTHNAVENIILGKTQGVINYNDYKKKIEEIAKQYDLEVPFDVPIASLSVGQQQKIEILKALYIDAKVLIMDEPTAVLTPQETDNLLLFIKEFTKKGNSVIFITHKLKEVIAVADRVIVMRTGKNVAEVKKGNFDENVLSNLMIGKDIAVEVKKEKTNIQDKKEVLKLENVSFIAKNGVKLLDNISFSIHEGEVFGIAGVSGNGQDEVCDIIAGIKKIKEGKVYFSDECVNSLSIKERNERGMGYVPLDRYRDAMVMDMTLAENMLLKHAFDKSWFKHGFIIDKKKLDNYTKEAIQNHLIKATGPKDKGKNLSGGNQQKVVLAREVDMAKKFLVLNQPTRGLDMGAVERIQNVILDEKKKGKAVLFISTELSELFEMCDKIAVMYKGKIMKIFEAGSFDIQEIGLLMAGVRKEAGK